MSSDGSGSPAPDVIDMSPQELKRLLQAVFATNGAVMIVLSVMLILYGAKMDRDSGTAGAASSTLFWGMRGATMVLVIGILLLVGGVLELSMGLVKAAEVTNDKPL